MFLADQAQEVHLIYLENDLITVNGRNLLAFDSGIDWDIKRVEGVSGMMGGGLFNMAPARHRLGWRSCPTGRRCCSTSASAPTFADAAGRDHLVLWRADRPEDRLQDEEPDRPRVGRDDADGVHGEGWLLVQPSEGRVSAPLQNA